MKISPLEGWLVYNRDNTDFRYFFYYQFPEKLVWKQDLRVWKKRSPRQTATLATMDYQPPSAGDSYWIRFLLTVVTGATSWEDLRTRQGVVYDSFKEAVAAWGFLEEDRQWYA